MQNHQLQAAQINHVDNGTIKIQVTSTVGLIPVDNAKITISYTGDPGNTLEQVTTDAEGQSEVLTLAAPPLEYSMEPEQSTQPYAEYTVKRMDTAQSALRVWMCFLGSYPCRMFGWSLWKCQSRI